MINQNYLRKSYRYHRSTQWNNSVSLPSTSLIVTANWWTKDRSMDSSLSADPRAPRHSPRGNKRSKRRVGSVSKQARIRPCRIRGRCQCHGGSSRILTVKNSDVMSWPRETKRRYLLVMMWPKTSKEAFKRWPYRHRRMIRSTIASMMTATTRCSSHWRRWSMGAWCLCMQLIRSMILASCQHSSPLLSRISNLIRRELKGRKMRLKSYTTGIKTTPLSTFIRSSRKIIWNLWLLRRKQTL